MLPWVEVAEIYANIKEFVRPQVLHSESDPSTSKLLSHCFDIVSHSFPLHWIVTSLSSLDCALGNQISSHLFASVYIVIPQLSSRTWVQGTPQITESLDAQVPYIKWHKTINTVIPSYPQIPNRRVPPIDPKYCFPSTFSWIRGYETCRYRGPTVLFPLGDAGNTDCKSCIF